MYVSLSLRESKEQPLKLGWETLKWILGIGKFIFPSVMRILLNNLWIIVILAMGNTNLVKIQI